jgi:hypothetical protein
VIWGCVTKAHEMKIFPEVVGRLSNRDKEPFSFSWPSYDAEIF